MRHWLWFLRGELCWLLGHYFVPTSEDWVPHMGLSICKYCWGPSQSTWKTEVSDRG